MRLSTFHKKFVTYLSSISIHIFYIPFLGTGYVHLTMQLVLMLSAIFNFSLSLSPMLNVLVSFYHI